MWMNRRKIMKRYWSLYVLMIIPLTLLLVYRYFPIILQIVTAFKDYKLIKGVWHSPWVGLDNFKQIIALPQFGRLIKNTLVISVLRLAWGFWPPIVLSIFLFDMKSKWMKRSAQTVLYIPHFFSWVIIFALAFAFFSNNGLFNSILQKLGLEKVNYFLESRRFYPILIGTSIWKELGWGTIIYLAALTSIDTQLYDAANIDGCGPLRRIWYITLPGIKNVTVFLLTLSLGRILSDAGTEQILLFYTPAVYDVADTIGTWVYRQGLLKLDYSLGTTLQFFQSAIGLLLILGANKVAKKTTGVSIW
jgi:putative aldouronate transport system permease protein